MTMSGGADPMVARLLVNNGELRLGHCLREPPYEGFGERLLQDVQCFGVRIEGRETLVLREVVR
jgi:hypothetical protein